VSVCVYVCVSVCVCVVAKTCKLTLLLQRQARSTFSKSVRVCVHSCVTKYSNAYVCIHV